MKLGEVVVLYVCYNFTKFQYILMKKIIILYQTHLICPLGAGEFGHRIMLPKEIKMTAGINNALPQLFHFLDHLFLFLRWDSQFIKTFYFSIQISWFFLLWLVMHTSKSYLLLDFLNVWAVRSYLVIRQSLGHA